MPDPNLLVGNPGDAFTRVPGPVDDRETVHVALASDGAPVAVVVDQTLTVNGTGDYRFSVQGPATDVRSPADQRVQPGLRQGRVIWQGFSVRSETLRASVALDMTFEAPRLPLAVTVSVSRAGKALRPPYDGPVRIDVTIEDRTALGVPVTLGVPEHAALGDLLDAMRAVLRAGRTPVAGHGLPSSLPGTSSAPSVLQVPAAFRVDGTLAFASGTFAPAAASGAQSTTTGGYVFGARLPAVGGAPLRVRLEGTARSLGAVRVALSARPQPPDPAALDLPGGATWRATLAHASDDTLRRALTLADGVLWQGLRSQEYEAHLGAPRLGSAVAEYLYATTTTAAVVAPAPRRGARPAGVALALVALAGVIANATALWLRS